MPTKNKGRRGKSGAYKDCRLIKCIKMKKILLPILSILILTTSACGSLANNYHSVKRVIDGDTLELANGEKVRLIGIDAPETHKGKKLYKDSQRTAQDITTITTLGKKSYQFTKELVEGRKVRLEFDVQKYDKYERLLAYVYLPDGTFVNAEIVKQGYANLLTIPPNVKYADLFRKLYQEARENKRGLWR